MPTIFEGAMEQLGDFLGFLAQRLEIEFSSGPDVLWSVVCGLWSVVCGLWVTCNISLSNAKAALLWGKLQTYANQLSG
jgi:hypothetical protein